MAAPLLLAMEPKMVSMMLATHKAVLFEQLARRQSDWTAEEVSKLSKAYSDGQLKPVMDDMMADAQRRLPKEPATQPVASQPSTSQPAASQPSASQPTESPPSISETSASQPAATPANESATAPESHASNALD
jgi:hypothetical protein